jgi:hypothetical protein
MFIIIIIIIITCSSNETERKALGVEQLVDAVEAGHHHGVFDLLLALVHLQRHGAAYVSPCLQIRPSTRRKENTLQRVTLKETLQRTSAHKREEKRRRP